MIEDYKIIKELGHGIFGTVYLVRKNKKYYVLKIEKIPEKELKQNYKSSIWREIEFAKNFANKHQDNFIKLIEYDIIDNCEHKQKYSIPLEVFGKSGKELLLNKNKSTYCIRKIYTLIDTTVYDIIEELNKKQLYSIFIQICYAIYLMNKYGYVHGDLHTGNIGLVKTNKKIKVFDKLIPSYGYQVKIIDYGSVLNKKYKLTKNVFGSEKKNFDLRFKYEILWSLSELIVNLTQVWEKLDVTFNFEKLKKEFIKMPEYQVISKLVSDDENQILLFQIMYPDKFQKIILGDKFKKTIPVKLYLPFEDLIFLLNATPIKEITDLKTIANYFIKQLQR